MKYLTEDTGAISLRYIVVTTHIPARCKITASQARSDAVGREKKLNEEHNLEINRLQAEVDEVKAKLENNERILNEFLENARG